MKKNNKNNKSLIAIILLASFYLLITIGILVWDLVSRIRRGWNDNDTVNIVFFVMILALCPVMMKSFYDFFANNSKEVMLLNNDIYRLFRKMEENGSISNYEKYLIARENKRNIDKINHIVRRKDKNAQITIDNLDEHFYGLNGLYKGNVNLFSSSRLETLYVHIKRNKSIAFERLYQLVHSGDLVKRYKFPLFEFVLPLLIGSIGLFATIYQTLASNYSIQESLTEYLKLFGSSVAFSFLCVLLASRSAREEMIKHKSNILRDMQISNKE